MPQFWFIAIGYLFVAVNLAINGLGICLPTCFGYAFIAAACWSLRDYQSIFRYGPIPASLLAMITFPDLFRGVAGDAIYAFYEWVLYPGIMLELALMAVVAVGLWREADVSGLKSLKTLAVAAGPVALGSLVTWAYFPRSDSTTITAAILIYEIPALYMVAVNAVAAKWLT